MKIRKDDPNVFNMGFLLVLNKVRAFEKRMLKESNVPLTPKELHHIVIIKTHPDLKQTEIIEFLDITKGTYSTSVKALVNKGYINSQPDPQDKRIKRLVVTPLGEKIIAINNQIREEIKKFVLSQVTLEEYETILNFTLRLGNY